MRVLVICLGLSLIVTSVSALSLSKAKKSKAKLKSDGPNLLAWPEHDHCHVGIIGGGIAGLYMAYEILNLYQTETICVFEKENDLGGRILDHFFDDAPNISVGQGAWRVDQKQVFMIDLLKKLKIPHCDWTLKKPDLYKSRGVASANEKEIKKAYPALKAHPTLGDKDRKALYNYLADKQIVSQAEKFPTFYSYVSNMTTSEGARFIHDLSYHMGEIQELVHPVHFIDFLNGLNELSQKYLRPVGGMSAIINSLSDKVYEMGGHIYTNTKVKYLSKRRGQYILETPTFTFRANKIVVAVPPGQFRKIEGRVARKIKKTSEFNSLIGIPAFKGAAVYRNAWWEKVKIGQTPVIAGRSFVSQDNCLGMSMAYRRYGPHGEGVLHTIYTDGHCARRWRDLAKLGKDYLDNEVHRALESKYGVKIPRPIDTDYQYWDSAWHFQRSGSEIKAEDVVEWAKRPFQHEDVFLVGEAYGPARAWCEGAIKSSRNALKEGWGIEPAIRYSRRHDYPPAYEAVF